MRNILLFFVLFLLLNGVENVFAQNSLEIEIDEEYNNFIVEFYEHIEENRVREQSQILAYCNLPGTFWVLENPIIIDGKRCFLKGYIFLDNNCVIEVTLVDSPFIYTHMQIPLSIPPYFYIISIGCAMNYNIVDGKIVVYDEILCYLEDTYLYFSITNEFRRYRLEDRFPIHRGE